MKKILMILAFSASVVFSREILEVGPMINFSIIHATGDGSGNLYNDAKDVGRGVKSGINLLMSFNSSLAFHAAVDVEYQCFLGSSNAFGDEIDVFQWEFHVPIAMRAYGGYGYVEAGLRPAVLLKAGWIENEDDEDEDSGSLDDEYRRAHVAVMAVIGAKLKAADFSISVTYDYTNVAQKKTTGDVRNLEIGFGFGYYIGLK